MPNASTVILAVYVNYRTCLARWRDAHQKDRLKQTEVLPIDYEQEEHNEDYTMYFSSNNNIFHLQCYILNFTGATVKNPLMCVEVTRKPFVCLCLASNKHKYEGHFVVLAKV